MRTKGMGNLNGDGRSAAVFYSSLRGQRHRPREGGHRAVFPSSVSARRTIWGEGLSDDWVGGFGRRGGSLPGEALQAWGFELGRISEVQNVRS